MNERVQLILKTKNISASRFADEIGVQRSSISHIISGRNKPSLDLVHKIIKRFPDINSEWIISGKGSMYKEQELFSSEEANKSAKGKAETEIRDSQGDAFDDNIASDQPGKEEKFVSETLRKSKRTLFEPKNIAKKIERIIIFYSDKTCVEYKVDQNA